MELTRNKLTDDQILHDYVNGKIEEEQLTRHQTEKLYRVRSCYGMLLEAKSTFFIIGTLIREFNLSQAQAYRDLRLTEKLFSQVRKSNKDIKRQIAENMARETYALAKKHRDLKAMNGATRNYIDATGCNIEDPETPDWNKIQPSVNIIMIPNALLKQLKNNLAAGPVIRKREDYAEYEEITDPVQSGGESGD